MFNGQCHGASCPQVYEVREADQKPFIARKHFWTLVSWYANILFFYLLRNTNEEDHYCVYIGVKNPPIWLVCAFKKLWIICEVMYFLIESIFGLVMSMGLASHWIKGFDCAKLHNLYPTSKVNNKQAAKSMHTQAFSLPHSFHYCLSQPTVSSLFISLTLPLYCMRVIGETSFANVTQYIKRNMVLLFRSWLGRL